MNALTFILKGKTAFFKKPDVNNYAYFTYNNIHKVALLGLLGAVIGLNGYRQQHKNEYPEFYEKLKNLRVSIVPLGKNGYFNKKIQTYTNTTGFYNKDSKKLPCSLVVREQWLYDSQWRIYILDDQSIDEEIFNKLKDYIINSKIEYMPYLGKNEHPADIIEGHYVLLEHANKISNIDSLFLTNDVTISNKFSDRIYEFTEVLPIRLENKCNSYKFDSFTFTNRQVINCSKDAQIYEHLGYSLYFF